MNMKTVVAVLAACVVCGCAKVSERSAREGTSSTVKTCEAVKASSFGFDLADSTAFLQKALDSGARKLIIDKQASDWIVEPLFITNSNIEVVLEDGVTVRAKKDCFHGRSDALVKVIKAHDVLIRGEGTATLVMNKRDYQDGERYAFSEWRHTLSIMGGKNVTVRDLTLKSSGGDGVYVRDAARNVRLENLKCLDHFRQGISLISCVDFLAKDCDFSDTDGAAPQCGVDIEPNRPSDKLTNVVFEDCTFNRNASGGIKLHLSPLNGKTDPISVVFRRCVCNDNAQYAIGVHGTGAKWLGKGQPGSVRGTVLFEDCTGKGNRGSAMSFTDMVPGGLKVTVRNCSWDAIGGRGVCSVGSSVPYDCAGVFCENVKVVTDGEPKISFLPYAGAGATEFGGKLTIVKDGRPTEIDLAQWAAAQPRDPSLLKFETIPVDYRKIGPASAAAKLAKPSSTGFIDKGFTFVQCLPAAGEYPITIQVARRVKDRKPAASVQLRDAAATDRGITELKEGANTFVLTSHGPAVFILEIRCGGGKVAVVSDWPGCGVLADAGVPQFWKKGTRWFEVPAGAEEVRVQVSKGSVAAELLNPAGEVVASKPHDGQTVVLIAKRAKSEKNELWGVRFADNVWVNKFRVGAPALPIISSSREAAIVAKP